MAAVVIEPYRKGVVNYPALNAQATISSETPPPQSRIIVKAFTFSIGAVAAGPAAVLQCVIRDGPTGTGTIIWTGAIDCGVNASAALVVVNTNFPCTAGNVATAEFVTAGGAAVQESVSMSYYVESAVS